MSIEVFLLAVYFKAHVPVCLLQMGEWVKITRTVSEQQQLYHHHFRDREKTTKYYSFLLNFVYLYCFILMLVLNEYLTNLFEFCTLFICNCFCFVAVVVVVEGGTNTPSSWQCGQCFE